MVQKTLKTFNGENRILIPIPEGGKNLKGKRKTSEKEGRTHTLTKGGREKEAVRINKKKKKEEDKKKEPKVNPEGGE